MGGFHTRNDFPDRDFDRGPTREELEESRHAGSTASPANTELDHWYCETCSEEVPMGQACGCGASQPVEPVRLTVTLATMVDGKANRQKLLQIVQELSDENVARLLEGFGEQGDCKICGHGKPGPNLHLEWLCSDCTD